MEAATRKVKSLNASTIAKGLKLGNNLGVSFSALVRLLINQEFEDFLFKDQQRSVDFE